MKNESDKDQMIVITTRCIDMAPPDHDVKKEKCQECGEMVWLSSQWNGKKIDKIICAVCFHESKEYESGDYIASVTDECLEDAKDWVRRNLNVGAIDDNEIRKKMIEVVESSIGKKLNVVRKEDVQ